MENKTNKAATAEWVDACLASLPIQDEGQHDAERSLSLLRHRDVQAQRRRQSRRQKRSWALVSVAVCLVALTIFPATRSTAQRMWNRFFQGNVEIVRVTHMNGKPPDAVVPMRPPLPASNAGEAAALAGFLPHFPTASALGEFGSEPTLMVRESSIQPYTIRVADLRSALEAAGVSPADASIPQEWDGVVIQQRGGPSVMAMYRDVLFFQTTPNEIIVPGGFAFDAFLEVLLRSSGLTAPAARERRNRFAQNPALLMFLPSDFKADVREISVQTGHGILVYNGGSENVRCGFCPDAGETLAVWSSADRMYGLKGHLTPERALAIANSIN